MLAETFFSRMVFSFYEVVPPVADIRFIGLVQLRKLTSHLLECQRRKGLRNKCLQAYWKETSASGVDFWWHFTTFGQSGRGSHRKSKSAIMYKNMSQCFLYRNQLTTEAKTSVVYWHGRAKQKTKNGARWVLRSFQGLVKVRLGWIIYYESKTFISRDTSYKLSPSVILLSFSGFRSM